MSSFVGLLAGAGFVCLAAFNVVTIFEASAHGTNSATRNRFVAAHRIGGYLFVMLFCIMCYLMLPRVLGAPGELPNFVLVHIVLVLGLIPVILAKVVIARRYKIGFPYLMPLGLLIFGMAFMIVLIPAMMELLSSPKPGRIVSSIALIVLLILCLLVAGLAVGPRKRPAAATETLASSPVIPGPVPASSSGAGRNPMTLVLAKIERQTHDTKTLRFLVPRERHFRAKPGQFLTFHWLLDGARAPRSYTISSSPSQTGYIEITPKRIPNGLVSTFLNERVKPGYAVEATGPHGQFYFDENIHKRIVLIAAGSGITPMMSILRYIEDRCLSTPITLLYFARTRHDIIFEKALENIWVSLSNFHYAISLSQPDDKWTSYCGRLTREFLVEQAPDFTSPTYFLCGPRGFMESARMILRSLGVADSQIAEESFGEERKGLQECPGGDHIVGEAEFVRSRKLCAIPAGSTLLEVAEGNGVEIPYGCRQGQCGTCATRLLKGTVQDYGGTQLAKEFHEGGSILACVARPQGKVSLDA